jgi:hypothetical protein
VWSLFAGFRDKIRTSYWIVECSVRDEQPEKSDALSPGARLPPVAEGADATRKRRNRRRAGSSGCT